MHLGTGYNCWSSRCTWSIACRHCSKYIFLLDLTPGFNGMGKYNCKTKRETFELLDLVCLMIEVWQWFLFLFDDNKITWTYPLHLYQYFHLDLFSYIWFYHSVMIWCHKMETFSASLAFFAGNLPVTGEFPRQRPVPLSFDVFFDLCLNKQLSKQSGCGWFEMQWKHCSFAWSHQYLV